MSLHGPAMNHEPTGHDAWSVLVSILWIALRDEVSATDTLEQFEAQDMILGGRLPVDDPRAANQATLFSAAKDLDQRLREGGISIWGTPAFVDPLPSTVIDDYSRFELSWSNLGLVATVVSPGGEGPKYALPERPSTYRDLKLNKAAVMAVRGGSALRDSLAAGLRWIGVVFTPPVSPLWVR
jgi:hypothetical protein